MAPAVCLYYLKRRIKSLRSGQEALLILEVLRVNRSADYPDGLKISYFLVSILDGKVILGLDNHRPKGLHRHFEGKEETLVWVEAYQHLEDFLKEIERMGFKL